MEIDENLLKNLEMRQVTITELASLREKNRPGIAIKIKEQLYYAPLSKLKIISNSDVLCKKHECSSGNYVCKKLIALPEPFGCTHILFPTYNIELLPFIVSGYQTINTKRNIFVVIECKNCLPVYTNE